MPELNVVFSHGKESGPWGTKIRAMAERVRGLGHSVESVDYQGMADPDARVGKLVDECRRMEGPIVLVGSSLGGHVATAAASAVRARGLFVLAPAYYLEGHGLHTPAAPDIPIAIVHGWRDDVVPVENSIRFARECSATLHVLDGDHRLTANIEAINDLLTLYLEAVSGDR